MMFYRFKIFQLLGLWVKLRSGQLRWNVSKTGNPKILEKDDNGDYIHCSMHFCLSMPQIRQTSNLDSSTFVLLSWFHMKICFGLVVYEQEYRSRSPMYFALFLWRFFQSFTHISLVTEKRVTARARVWGRERRRYGS